MKKEYAWIIIIYVPGGCTPLLQACDVGIQKILKLAIKKSAHADVVDETLVQLNQGVLPEAVIIQKTIGTLWDRSVQWMVDGFNMINRVDVVKKVGFFLSRTAFIPLTYGGRHSGCVKPDSSTCRSKVSPASKHARR